MSDIYKNREAMPVGGERPSKQRKRRRTEASVRRFDDRAHKRRGKNSGFRRLLHLSRKSSNEKFFWGTIGVVFCVILLVVAVWQYVIIEQQVRAKEKEVANQYHPRYSAPAGESASK